MELLRVISSQDMWEAFGINKNKEKELTEFMDSVVKNTTQHSQVCARLWNNEVLLTNEKIFLVLTYGMHVGFVKGKSDLVRKIMKDMFGPPEKE